MSRCPAPSGRSLRSAGLAALLCLTARAAPAVTGQDLLDISLEGLMAVEILESAARYPTTIEDAPAVLDVLTAEEIAEIHPLTLADLLAQFPGLMVENDRVMTRLGVRMGPLAGDDNTRVLLLVDGQPAGNAYTGTAPLDGLAAIAPGQLERIEVTRGPGSAVLGSNALAATINLVTRPGTTPAGGWGRLSADPGNRAAGAEASWGWRGEDSALAIHAQRRVSRGGASKFDNGAPYTGVPDASEQAGARIAWRRGALRLSAAHARIEQRIPHEWFLSLPANRENRLTRRQSGLQASWSTRPRAGHELTLRASAHAFQGYWWYVYEPFDPELQPWDLWRDDGRERGLGVAADYILVRAPRLRGAFGIESRWIEAEQHAGYRTPDDEAWAYGGDRIPEASQVHRFSIVNAYATGQAVVLPRVQAFLGLNWNRTYGDERLTPKTGGIFEPGRGWTLKAMVGEGFRSPTIYQRFYTDAEVYIDNPALSPETVRTGEISLLRRLGRESGDSRGGPPRLSLTAHLSRYEALIQSADALREETPHAGDPQYADTLSQYVNRGGIRAYGIEAALRGARLAGWRLAARLSWQRAEDERGERLPNTPAILAGLRAARRLGAWQASFEGRLMGARDTHAGDPAAAHATAHATLGWEASRAGTWVRLRIDNLFDTPGRTVVAWPDFHPVASVPIDGRRATFSVETRL